MKKQTKPEHFFHNPKYPGGRKAMDAFIRNNMQYPHEAIQKKIEGTVALKFDIDEYGMVSNVQVLHGIGSGCDEEAVRLAKLLRYEKTKKAGLRVTFHQSLNIHFRLSHQEKISPPEEKPLYMAYHYSDSGKDGSKTVKTITYTIKIKGNQ